MPVIVYLDDNASHREQIEPILSELANRCGHELMICANPYRLHKFMKTKPPIACIIAKHELEQRTGYDIAIRNDISRIILLIELGNASFIEGLLKAKMNSSYTLRCLPISVPPEDLETTIMGVLIEGLLSDSA